MSTEPAAKSLSSHDDDQPRQRMLERTALLLSLLALGLLMGALGYKFLYDTDAWDPLSEYPEQTVVADDTYLWEDASAADGTIEVPAVPLGPVTVIGTKCADENVTISGDVAWLPTEPPGTPLGQAHGSITRGPGCLTRTFVNEPPDDVIAWAQKQLDAGITPVMRIAGTDTPTRNGTAGEPRGWSTEPFAFTEAE